MRYIVLAAVVALSLTACTTTQTASIPGSPADVANQTKLDEQLGAGVTLGYRFANRAAAALIRNKVITDPAVIARIGELDKQGYAAVQKVRAAYLAGNATSYQAAIDAAEPIIERLATAAGL